MAGPTAEVAPLVGRTLGHYCILEKIGEGGMGEVYRAHDDHLEREVAIKVLSSVADFTDRRARMHFHQEALALSKLNHPNIATIYDFDTQAGVDFLVMEYIAGITLNEKLAARPLPEHELISLGASWRSSTISSIRGRGPYPSASMCRSLCAGLKLRGHFLSALRGSQLWSSICPLAVPQRWILVGY
jgi:serine/threonine protein kinase